MVDGSAVVSDSVGVVLRPLSIPGLETDPEESVARPLDYPARKVYEDSGPRPLADPSPTDSSPLMAGCALPIGCLTDARFHHRRDASLPISSTFLPVADAVFEDDGASRRVGAISAVAAPADPAICNWQMRFRVSNFSWKRYSPRGSLVKSSR